MKSMPTNSLRVNSYIDSPVYLDKDYILLSPDIPITQEMKNRLLKWEFNFVQTDGSISDAPPNKAVSESGIGKGILDKSVKETENQNEALQFYNSTLNSLTNVFKRFKLKDELRLDESIETIKKIISMLKTNNTFLLSISNIKFKDYDYNVTQSVKTAILALILADFLKFPPHQQIDIGIAGLMHRIGLLKIPESIYMTDKPLSEQQEKTIRAHPILGFKILKAVNFPSNIAMAVLEQHEHVDGTGYPRKISGDKISIYGKILSVSCSYTAAVSKRPYKSGLDGHSGIMDIVKGSGKKYDDKIIRALVLTLSVFPIGTYVLLSNNAKGIVIKTNIENPRHPIVKLLVNEEGLPYMEQPILQTHENDLIRILRPLNKQEIKELKTKL